MFAKNRALLQQLHKPRQFSTSACRGGGGGPDYLIYIFAALSIYIIHKWK